MLVFEMISFHERSSFLILLLHIQYTSVVHVYLNLSTNFFSYFDEEDRKDERRNNFACVIQEEVVVVA